METRGRIWSNFELMQAFMHVIIACKYEKDQMKNSGENVMTSFSPLSVYGIFFRCSRAANSVVHGRISPNFELIQALMDFIVTCKYEPYLLPWKPVVPYGRISNSSKLLCMSSLPANMKSIQLKIAEKM